eukprot:GILI01029057.1.p1 GENE.GILI01029057.1~~GILI01029057.1.p1  ORF type:complete len:251 (-),score=28.25 GILI01029057.1:92-817(-)
MQMQTRFTTGYTKAFLACATPAASAVQCSRWSISDASQNARRDEILDFWFGQGWRSDPPQIEPNFPLWFDGSPEIDQEIKSKFGADVRRAKAGDLSAWMDAGPLDCLALIILLDQFALNIFRDLPDGYICSQSAVSIAHAAVARGYPRQVGPDGSVIALPIPMRMFFYLPFEHSELLQDQDVSVALCEQLAADTGDASLTAYAKEHRDIIEKYGRFPGRNKCMGRESNAAELQYLADGGIY